MIMKVKRIQALFLAVIMVLSMTVNTVPAYAEPDSDPSLCPHHTEHTGCNYSEGTEGTSCKHTLGEHDDTCGYVAATEGISCDMECTDTDMDGTIDHADDCAYQPASEGNPCSHESGAHDEDCGYTAPVAPVPCDFVCSICDCTCTSRCEEGAVSNTCPVCSSDYADCSFTTVEVSMDFEDSYHEFGSAALNIGAVIDGPRITQINVSIQLTDEEAAMLNNLDGTDISLTDNALTFTLQHDDKIDREEFNTNITFTSTSLSSIDISEEDIQVTIEPKDYQDSEFVEVTRTGDRTTFVEKLPDDTSYGSGTAYETTVEDVTVHYVDNEGNAASRQEAAPTFTLYYQVEGKDPVALSEENLPFGMTAMPEITAEAGDGTWTGKVQDPSSLPSVVLAPGDNGYSEKSVTWYLEPSYPADYYENAGTLVRITDDNASQYPAGLGRGWYFIGGKEPYPEDTVEIEEYTSLSHDVYWADNGDAGGIRPADLSGLYELQFSLDGSSSYKTLTGEDLETLGLSELPEATVDKGSGVWQIHWDESLPDKITYSDSTGNGASLTRDVNWRVVFNKSPDSYTMVEVTPENAGNYSSVQDQYGTYYVLETSLTFDARIYQGDKNYNEDSHIGQAFRQQFYLDASYSNDQHQYYQLESVNKNGNYMFEEVTDDPNLIRVTISNLWRYNLDNTRINYSIREGEKDADRDNRLNDIIGLEEGDYFAVSYDNSAVPSFSSETTAVYSGGLLKFTLTGTVDYHATKVWLDDGETQRPTATLELWRYRSGQSYTTASLVRGEDGTPYTLVLSEDQFDPDTGSYRIEFSDDLPKYDPEGHRYRYVVREYLSGTNASSYEQVFGSVAQNGTVTDTLPEYSPRNANDTFLYNGGTLSNRLKGTVPVSVTKDWKAASFQSEFEDVMVRLRLQSRYKDPVGGSNDWTDTEYTYEMFGFLAENLTVTHTGNYPQYDAHGRELEYRWVEEAVFQGGTVTDDGEYVGGTEVPCEKGTDGSRTFTLTQNGREVIYSSSCDSSDTDEEENCTVITNSIANVIDYDVTKTFFPEWNETDYASSYTFSLFRSTSGSPLERYADFTIHKDADAQPTITGPFNDNATLTIEQRGEWHVVIHGLPEFDADGQQYEYLLLEANGNPLTIETERDEITGDYSSVVKNGPGGGNIILVRKEWIDESDSQHRLPVKITVYSRDNNTEITSVLLGGDNPWHALVGIGQNEPGEVYILETHVGETEVPNPENTDGSPIPPTYFGNDRTAVQFKTEYHDYEATYSYDNDFGASGSGDGAYEGIHCYTVTNRRLGNIDLTVTKNWLDGDGEKRKELNGALAAADLQLAVRLDFMSEPSLGQTYEITTDGFGNNNTGDTVTISQGNATPITDKDGQSVYSIQLLNLETETGSQTLYFWNLPKYDGNGASVRYTVEEVFVDQNGEVITDLSKEEYKDLLKVWQEYSKTTETGPYIVGTNHAKDTQDFTLTNKLSGTVDVNWYTLWQDRYAYDEGSRPDIYLNIYSRTHVKDEDGNVTTQNNLVIRNYRWEFDAEITDSNISEQNFWKCTIESLPQYDDLGYEIDYFAVMDSVVTASDFDYLATSYAPNAAITSDQVFATAAGLLDGKNDPGGLLLNVSGDGEASSYALLSGNTFINTIYDTITVTGEKLWTNLPDAYPMADLPTVTFTLSRSLEDGTTESNIATMTIDASDWEKLNVNGHYVFVFGLEDVNEPASSFDAEAAINKGKTLLPRFDSLGRLYTYTLKEEVKWNGTAAENSEEKNTIFTSSSSGQTHTNSYNLKGNAQLSAKKYLTVPAGQNVYPAVKMVLTRTYTKNDGTPSTPETVSTLIWSAADVKTAVESGTPNNGMVTVKHTFTWDGLPVYAPNGSSYQYTVTEDKSQLGGFDTWAVEGNLEQAAIKNDSDNKDVTEVGDLTADNDNDIDATFLNEPVTDPDPIQLTGGKVWYDLNPSFRPDITEGLEIKLKQRADAQTDQNNSITWQKVEIDGSNVKIEWKEDLNDANRWTYTITGLDRYAPNGMPWIYQVTETAPKYYTPANNGIAGQNSQDSTYGNITMNNLSNSMLTSKYFRKTWVDSDGTTITENLFGEGIELEVSFELQLRTKAGDEGWSTTWQSADGYFASDTTLNTRTYTGSIRAALGAATWNNNYRFQNLPVYVKVDETVYQLEYRVVETGVKVYAGSDSTDPIYEQGYEAPMGNGDAAYAYTTSGGGMFTPYYGPADAQTQDNDTINHKNQIQTTEITVSKQWAGDNNTDYVTRPESTLSRYDWEVTLIVVRSTDGGKSWDLDHPVAEVPLHGYDNQNSASDTVDGLPSHIFDDQGHMLPCTYRVFELQSDAATETGETPQPLNPTTEENKIYFNGTYSVSYSANGYTAVNTLQTTEFTAKKIWNDNGEARPAAITLELKYLKKDGDENDPGDYVPLDPAASVTLPVDSEDNSIEYTWKNLPKSLLGSELDANGTTIYRAFETVTGDYIIESSTAGGTTTITNTPSITPGVIKHWLGALEKEPVTVVLYRNTEQNTTKEQVATVVLSDSNQWKHKFDPQPKYDATGNAYTYWVEETLINGEDAAATAAEDGFLISYGGDVQTGFEVYNHELDAVYVIKDWADDADPQENPKDLELTLERTTKENPDEKDWEPVTGFSYTWTQDETAADRWNASFAGLPQYEIETGKQYTYRVTETVPAGYEGEQVNTTAANVFHFKNTLSERIDIPVQKLWEDNSDKQGWRPEAVTVALYANGKPTGKTLELKPGMFQNLWNFLTGSTAGWGGVFKDLPKYDDEGALIEYSVVETSVTDHYEVSYGEVDGTLTVTNTADGSLTVTKQVTGSGDPSAVFHFKVELDDGTINGTYGDMNFRDGVAEFTLSHGQSAAAGNLPGGVSYTVTEIDANQGAYTTSGSGETGTIRPGDTAKAVFTNELRRTSIPVTKIWKDGNDKDDIRPDKVTVKLLADGADTGKTLILSKENRWSSSFTDLDEYRNGQKIAYTVEEVPVSGYSVRITGDAAAGFTITNSHTPDTSDGSNPPGVSSTYNPVDTPRTGDSANPVLWIALLIISVISLTAILITLTLGKKKRHRGKRRK